MRRAGPGWLAAVALLAAAASAAARPPTPAPSVEIQLSRKGFRPPEVVLRKGEQVAIVLTSDGGEHCFAVDAFRIEKRVRGVRPTSFEFTPDRAGRFPAYCCLHSGEAAESERGEVVVTE